MRSLFWVCAVLVVVSCVTSTNLWRELRAERELSAALRTQLEQAAGRGSKLMPVMSPAEPESAQATREIPSAPAAKSTPPVAESNALRDSNAEGRALWEDPQFLKAQLAQTRANLVLSNSGMAEDLGLSAPEADRVFDLMAERELKSGQAITLLVTVADQEASSEDASKSLIEFTRQRDDAIAATLGAAKFAQWQQYQQDSEARSRVVAMSSMLLQDGQPLSAGQLKSLTAIVVPQIRRQRQDIATVTGSLDLRDPAAAAQAADARRTIQGETDGRILASAAKVLNSRQLKLIRAQIDQKAAVFRALSRAKDHVAAAHARAQAVP